jgi:DNA-binding transcriptional MerR regulator
VLRFWESRFPQIRPMKRGGGRRYYRPDDVDLLRGVRHLLYGEGYTIRGVQRILREQGAAFVQSVWRADAEPLPPALEEDRIGDDDTPDIAAAKRSEPNLFGLRPAAQRTADADQPSEPRTEPRTEPRMEAAPGIESPTRRLAALENRRKLQSALDELVACRALIDAAFHQQ